MLHPMPFRIAVAALLAFTPAPGLMDAAHAGSSSRSDTRHDLTQDDAVEAASSRGKARRATRSTDASEEVVTQNLGKRSRRNPSETHEEAPVIAKMERVETDLVALAEVETDAIAKHIRAGEFDGETGLLALYQLTGKAAAGMPLVPVEIKALSDLTAERDLAVIIAETETRLIESSGDADMLDAIAEALGIPRPEATPGVQSNLGASLLIENAGTNG